MGRRIFRRPYMFMRHRARRMENRLVRAVGKGSMVGAGTGAMAGSVLSSAGSKQSHAGTTRKRDNASFGSRAGSAVGAVLDTKKQGQGQGNGCQGEYQGYADPDRLCRTFR